jgi:paraquat-inducible protein B
MTDAVIVNKKAWRISPIWFLPLTALLLSLWLAYETFMHKGIEVIIYFTSGSGMAVNKTKVMYKGISIGKVIDVEIDKTNIEQVIVKVLLDKRTKPYLLSDTQFWLVKPTITLGGVSGLDTLMSGNYIGIKPGIKGTPKSNFLALKNIPIDDDGQTSLVIELHAKTLGSIVPSSPVYYKKIKVGVVLGSKYNKTNDNVLIKLDIDDEYAHLLKKHSRFYNVSGIQVTGGLSGIKVKTESLSSILLGGIAFYTPENESLNEPAEDGDLFPLFDDFESADIGIAIHLKLKDVNGLSEGNTAIKYQGKKIGLIKEITIDYKTGGITASAYINPMAEDLLKTGTKIWKVKPVISINKITGIETLIKGIHLEINPSSDNPDSKQSQNNFEVLEEKPGIDISEPGLHLNLSAKRLGSLQVGSGIYFKNIKIGSIQSYYLNDSNQLLSLEVFIKPEYADLIKSTSSFYKNSGFSIKGGISGLSIKAESLSTLISGGISVYNPDFKITNSNKSVKAKNGQNFELFDDLEYASSGYEIDIIFSDISGIKEDITRVKYRGVDLGYVSKIEPNKNIQTIKVTLKIDPIAKNLLRKATQFWLVKPEVSLSGVSGLDTILGGSYISFKSGKGSLTKHFKALDSPPSIKTDKGLIVSVKAPELGSVSIGSPLLYHQIEVGQVISYRLSKSGENIIIDLFIDEQYKKLVRKQSRFYQASGVSIKGGISGLDIRTESLSSIIKGGIAFFTPKNALLKTKTTLKTESRQLFDLFSDRESALKNQFLVSVVFPDANDIKKGTKLKFNGLEVGEVKSLNLHTDLEQIIVELLIDNKLRQSLGKNSQFKIVKAEFGLAKTKNLDTLISGSYIVVKPAKGNFSRYFQSQEYKLNKGLKVTLTTDVLGSIKQDSLVYYRQVKVGQVDSYELSKTADKVLIYILIEEKYAPLVRENSKFWNASGINMDINLFAGSKIKTESIQSILDGGISFATPDSDGKNDNSQQSSNDYEIKVKPRSNKVLAKKVRSGSIFTLHKEVEQKWLKWNPKISLENRK